MLAEKLETPHEFHQARDMGFVYFQGYFFCRPEIVIGHEVPASRLHYIRLLEMVSRSEMDMPRTREDAQQEASLSYRLLRYLNSPVFGFALEIKSIRHAMAVLGEREMPALDPARGHRGAAEQTCNELVLMGLARARFCELLSNRVRADTDLFLMGLLSIMDAILEVTMDVLLEQLPVDRETKSGAPRPEQQPAAAVPTHAGPGIGEVVGIERTRQTVRTTRRGSGLNLVAGPAVAQEASGV